MPGSPERVVVDERWHDRAAMLAAATAASGDDRLARIRELLDPEHPPTRTELEPVGGAACCRRRATG